MLYEIRHQTRYEYDHDVSLSHHVTRISPRDLPCQHPVHHQVDSFPTPATQSSHHDHFGNPSVFLTIEGPHRRLEITAFSTVEILPQIPTPADSTPPWETIRDLFRIDSPDAPLDAAELIHPSPLVPRRPDIAEFARTSFPQGRPLLDGALDLSARIHRDFQFDPLATAVSTPVSEFFRNRRGVCQDFAHLTVACLRSLGLPARYVSGYLETLPPPGQPKLIGTDASHAWIALWCGDAGWIDIDPTNNLLPSDRHVTVAWGRDFSDVSPVRGVTVGSGTHQLHVSVDMTPVTGR